MKKGLIITLAFLTGGATGGFAAWRFFKKKYRKIADEEVKSVKEEFRKRYEGEDPFVPAEPVSKDIPPAEPEPEKESKTEARREYEASVTRYNSQEAAKTITILTPQQFNESDNVVKELDFFSDGVVAYHDTLEKLNKNDILLHIGPDALSQIGKYEADAIHVRNTRFNIDYQVLKQPITYKAAQASRAKNGQS